MIMMKRLIALAIDCALLFVVFAAHQFVLAAMLDSWVIEYDDPALAQWAWVALTVTIPSWLYFTLRDADATGQTIGKRIMQLGVRSVNSGPVGLKQSVVRNVVKLIPWRRRTSWSFSLSRLMRLTRVQSR